MEQPSNINITPVNRAFLQEQGILKGMGSQIKKRKMQQKPVQKSQPKKPVQKKPVTVVNKSAKPKQGLIEKYEQKAPKGYVRGEMGGLYKESDMKKHRDEFAKSLQHMKNTLAKKSKK
jgi:hypothetical protein